jgi:hypothetical protein
MLHFADALFSEKCRILVPCKIGGAKVVASVWMFFQLSGCSIEDTGRRVGYDEGGAAKQERMN